jgi:hypothetical protein|tara:strand:+ start:413 stop:568 length:156 start_codon:yes stop_codon:yes gene_type:complete
MHVGTTAHHVGFLGCRQSLGEDEVVAQRAVAGTADPQQAQFGAICQYTTLG